MIVRVVVTLVDERLPVFDKILQPADDFINPHGNGSFLLLEELLDVLMNNTGSVILV